MPDRNPTHSFSPDSPATPSDAGSAPDPAATHSDAAAAATTGGASAPARTGPPPTAAGRYQIGEEIAHGGMGVVFRATDTALGREVAVKVLHHKYQPDSGAARRFADEARIAAQLQHPAIPPVHDLGTLPDGRPFLAMKLIKGRTLDALLDARPDPSHDRGRFVAAFEQVCQAVAYAHAHNVIHRDLKPANVMVGAFGEVQVMDWGLAKVLTDRTRPDEETAETAAGTQVVSLREADGLFTQAGSVLGTPAFMPPEQAVGAVGKVDERSDVFGLGAVLAVILTGQAPFAGGSSETIRVRAAQGHVDECFGRLDRCGADPDLAALCKGCLAPRPRDRPADAGAVARAVAGLRQAADERARQAELDKVRVEGEKTAAEARAAERRKRRRVWQGSVAVLAVAVVGGLGAVLAVQRRANADLAATNGELAEEQAKVEARNRQLADEQAKVEARNQQLAAEKAKVEARNQQLADEQARVQAANHALADERAKLEQRNGELAAEQVRAEARFELARKAIEKFHTGVTEDALLTNEEFKELKTRMLKEAAGFYAEMEKVLAGQTDVKSRKALAAGYFRLGELTDKIGSQTAALAVHRKGLAVRRELAAVAGADVDTRLDVARSLNAVAGVLSATGDKAGALKTFEEARDLGERLEADKPTTAVRSVLGQTYRYITAILSQTGGLEAALVPARKGLAIRQKLADAHPDDNSFQSDLAWSHNQIGNILSETGKTGDGLASLSKARDIQQKLADAEPNVAAYQTALGGTSMNIGRLLLHAGRAEEALVACQKAEDVFRNVANTNPAVNKYQSDLAAAHYQIGYILSAMNKWSESLKKIEQARIIFQKLVDANPTVTDYQGALARCYHLAGTDEWNTGKPAIGLAHCQLALDLKKKVVAASPKMTNHQADLARSYQGVGELLAQSGQVAKGAAMHHQGTAIFRQLIEDEPTATEFKMFLASGLRHWTIVLTLLNRVHSENGARLIQSGRWQEAVPEFEECRLIVEQLVAANPDVPVHTRELAAVQYIIGVLMKRTDRPAEALASYHKGRDLQLKLVADHPKVADYQLDLARSHDAIGRLLVGQKQHADAFTALDKSLDLRQKLADANPKSPLYAGHLASAYGSRGWARVRAGQPAEAAADLRRAVELWAKYLPPDLDPRIERVRTLAQLAGLGADPKAGVTAAEAAGFADKAVAALADILKGGWILLDELKEPDFDALRGRADFQKLMKEMEAKVPKVLEVAPPPRPKGAP